MALTSVVTGLGVSFLLMLYPDAVPAAFSEPAVVKEGAFLLSAKPNKKKLGRPVHGLVSYLPTGTIVFYDTKEVRLKNHETGEFEQYNPVLTDAGVNGLLREDLRLPLPEKPVIVATADRRLPVRRKSEKKKLADFSRSDGVYLEVVSTNPNSQFYDVRLSWTERIINGQPTIDEGRFDKDYVKYGDARLIDRAKVTEILDNLLSIEITRAYSEGVINDLEEMLGRGYNWMIDEISEATAADVGKIKSYLRNIVLSPCRVSLKASATLDATLWGTGLLMETFLDIKEKGFVYSMDSFVVRNLGPAQSTPIVAFRRVKCTGTRPSRLNDFVVQPVEASQVEGLNLSIETVPDQIKREWDPNLKSPKVRSRMLAIEGYEQFTDLYEYLQEQITEGSFVSQLTASEQHTLIMFLITQIGHFQKPPLVGG